LSITPTFQLKVLPVSRLTTDNIYAYPPIAEEPTPQLPALKQPVIQTPHGKSSELEIKSAFRVGMEIIFLDVGIAGIGEPMPIQPSCILTITVSPTPSGLPSGKIMENGPSVLIMENFWHDATVVHSLDAEFPI
jgi:hypothetical protein